MPDPSGAPAPGRAASTRAGLIAVLGGLLLATIAVTAPAPAATAPPVLFADGFESGGLTAWSGGSGLAVQSTVVADGAWAARATMSGAGASAWAALPAPATEITATTSLRISALSGTASVNFLKVRTATGTALAEVYLTPSRLLGVRNDVTGVATNSTTTLATDTWRRVALHVLVADTASRIDVTLDGTPVPGLSLTTSLGTTPVGRVQVGENVAGRTADLYYDTVQVTGPAPPEPVVPVLFADGFESGGLTAWSGGSGLAVQSTVVADGAWAARATMSGAGASAWAALPAPATEITATTSLRISALSGTASVNFLKVRTATGTALAEVYLTPSRLLGVRNDVTGVATNSTTTLATDTWRRVALHVLVADTASRIDVTLDGTPVPGLSLTTSLGTTPVGRVQVGENVAGRTADLYYDTVQVTGPAPPEPVADPVLMAAGDIACDPLSSTFNGGSGVSGSCRQRAVSDLVLADRDVDAVAALGDVQYYCGGAAAFAASYDPSWGRFRSLTRPAVGNHEYIRDPGTTPATDCDTTGGAGGYFGYFGAAAGTPGQGWYSYDLGSWHVIALNSNCGDAGGCGPGSAQDAWLQADLAAHPTSCTLAYWHIPLWSSGGRAAPNSASFMSRLYAAGADVVLTGHDHVYERFAPQNPAGQADLVRGIRSFVVGTGGANHTTFPSVAPNSEVRDASTFGVLRLVLHPTGYDWRFVPEAGRTFTDAGSGSCH